MLSTMTFLSDVISEITSYLTRCESNKKALNLVKFHESCQTYDFSFPSSLHIWRNYIKDFDGCIIEENEDDILRYSSADRMKDPSDLLKVKSLQWTFVIQEVELKNCRYHLKLQRSTSYCKVLQETSINPSYGKCEKVEDEMVSLETLDEDNSISHYRVELIEKVLRNLIGYSKFVQVSDPNIAKHKILVTSKSNLAKNHSHASRKLLICGIVLNPIDKKLSEIIAQDYINKRCEDMHLTSIHKYGVRAKNDEEFRELIVKLGRYAATLDLLEVKPSSAVLLSPDPRQAFILYNSARLETLMAKFEAKVLEGYYNELPNLNEIDTNLLREDEEWQLWKILIAFPDVIDRSINELSEGRASIHLLHKFLTDLVTTFSIYYRRVRLLTENRQQLMPVLHAKIHFLRSVRRVLNETLAIFCIEPIAFMWNKTTMIHLLINSLFISFSIYISTQVSLRFFPATTETKNRE